MLELVVSLWYIKERRKPMAKKRGNGEGSIRKRSDGRWEGIIVVGHKNDGSAILKSVFGKTQKECIANLQKAIELYKGAELTEDSRMTLGEWLNRWLDAYVVFRVRESTLHNYRYQIRLISEILGDKPLHTITTADVQKMYNKLKTDGRKNPDRVKGTELSNTVVRSVHMMLHQAMDVAVKEHLIPKNPTNGTTIPKKETQPMQVLNESELERFKAVIEQDELWYEFFYTELTTGLRRGEICGLKWKDFNIETDRLHIQRAVTVKKGGGFYVGDTKTTNSERYMLLPPRTAEMLKKRKENALGEWIFPNHLNPDLPIHPTTVYNHMKTLLKKAELPLIRFHDLRHTFATHAMANDVDAKTLSSILGHTEASFTLDTYTHVTSDMQRNAASIVGSFMKNLLGEELTPCRKEENTDQAH